jgi:hypothetical protein
MDVPECALPFSISAILANETFEVPSLRGLCNLPHKLLVDLYAQTRPLQSLDEPILNSESFWVCDVAVDVILTSCVAREQSSLARFVEQCRRWETDFLPSTL